MPTLAGIEDAVGNIRPHLAETPLVHSPLLSLALEAEVWLKNETVTPIASFKIRGALNAVIRARARGPLTGVVTSSTGNHGQGVAWAGARLGVPAHIYLPTAANPVKAAMIEAFGGTLHKQGADIDQAKDAALGFARNHGHLFIDDGNDLDIMEGAGTAGLEIARVLDRIDEVYVPTGGGNFVSGVAAALRATQPEARVIAVQAKGSPALVDSFHAGRAVERPIDTIADGLHTRVPPALALAAMIKLVDDAVLVSDRDLLAGIRTIAECAHVLVEPAGAAALAAAWAARESLRGRRVVLVLTGANIAMAILRRALAAAPFFSAAASD